MDMTPEQCRAARAWLDWKQADLAERAKLSLSTVRDFEKGRRSPTQESRAALAAVFLAAGLRPTFDARGRASGISCED